MTVRSQLDLTQMVWHDLEIGLAPKWVAHVYGLTVFEALALAAIHESNLPRRTPEYDREPWLYARHRDHRTARSHRPVLRQLPGGFALGLQAGNPWKLMVGLCWGDRYGR